MKINCTMRNNNGGGHSDLSEDVTSELSWMRGRGEKEHSSTGNSMFTGSKSERS